MILIVLFFIATFSCLLSFVGYHYIVARQPGDFFYILSGKSTSRARLLGGLPLALTILSFLFISLSDQQAAVTIIPALIITGYGFYDDKFEMRARLKLIFQALSVGTFAFFVASNMVDVSAPVSVALISFLGMALVNGTNLLDGLDTMTVKTSGTSLLGFLVVSVISDNSFSTMLSIVLMASLAAFYFFNRAPARLYLGEIGGSFIGLMSLVLAVSNYSSLSQTRSKIESLSYVLILVSLPLNELAISFWRRVWSRRSPFRGDRLHLHHILCSKYEMDPSATSSAIACGNMLVLLVTLPIAEAISPTLGLLVNVGLTAGTYVYFCHDTWAKNSKRDGWLNPFRHFINKPVMVVNTRDIEDSSIIIFYDKIEDATKAA